MKRSAPAFAVFLLIAVAAFAQRRSGGGFGFGGESYIPDDARTAREVASHSTGSPEWKNPPGFEHDVFTFARVKRGGRGRGGGADEQATSCARRSAR